MNGTTPQQVDAAHYVLFTVLWLFALLFNLTSSVFLGRVTHLRTTWPHILLLSLACTDSVLLLISGSIAVASLFRPKLLHESLALCYVQGFVLNSTIVFSSFVVGFISVDRYFAVCHPFYYSSRILNNPPIKVIVLLLSALSILALVVATLPLATRANYSPLDPSVFCWYNYSSPKRQNIATVSINTGFMILVLLVVLYCTMNICIGLYKEQSSLHKRSDSDVHISNKMSHLRANFAKLSVVIAIVFSACTTPHVVVVLIHLLSNISSIDATYFTLNILLLNSLINPLLYVVIKPNIRAAYKEAIWWIMYCVCCCRSGFSPRNIDEVLLGCSQGSKNQSNPVAVTGVHNCPEALGLSVSDPYALQPHSIAASSSCYTSNTTAPNEMNNANAPTGINNFVRSINQDSCQAAQRIPHESEDNINFMSASTFFIKSQKTTTSNDDHGAPERSLPSLVEDIGNL